ncbi:MAG: methyl-accepting chemotaxis protein [Solirubrobacteraceae bacterium]|jgi:PAS domain-containing protein
MSHDDAPSPAVAASLEEIQLTCIRSLIASTSERVWFKDRESRFLLASIGLMESFRPGLTLDELIGKTDFDFFSEVHAQAAYDDEQRVIRTGEALRDVLEVETFDDRPDTWVSTTKMPLRNANGETIGTWGYCSDASAQADALQALEASRQGTARGLEVIVEVIDGFGELSEQTKHVSELLQRVTEGELRDVSSVSTVIDDVAGRTKLLSLNAAIEAARAGEHGRGFAIVADEVGRLAAETAEQTARITATISRIQTEMRAVREAADAALQRAASGAEQAGDGRRALEKLTALLDTQTNHVQQPAARWDSH